MTKLYLCGLLLVVVPVVSLAEMETGRRPSEQAECKALPESLQTIVEAMSKPGENVRALAARDKLTPLITMVQRVVGTLLPVGEVSFREVRSRRMGGSSGRFAGLLALLVPRDGVYRI